MEHKGQEVRPNEYLFRYLLLANFLQYLEAGAVPALLLQLSNAFGMNSGQQGLLGGVVYLSLSLGGPIAGYLLRTYDHKTVLAVAISANILATFTWAMTPIGKDYSSIMFISIRFLIGFFQCVVCVFLPLWTNENAPKHQRTSWMSYLQASVPFGVMMGYIVAAVISSVADGSEVCFGLECWRWPFLIEVGLLLPLYVGFTLVPSEHITVPVGHKSSVTIGKDNELANGEEMSYEQNCSMDYPRGNWNKDKYSSPLRRTTLDRCLSANAADMNKNSSDHYSRRPMSDTFSDVEKRQLSQLRQQSITASFIDAMSAKNVIKDSCDDFFALQDRTNEDHSDDNSPDSEEDDTNKKNIRFEEGEVSSTRSMSDGSETVISDPNNVPLDHDIRLPRLLSTSKILRELKANPTVNTNKYLERDCKVYADPTDQTHISEYNKSKAWNSWFGWSNGNKSKGDNLVVRKFNEYGSTAPESKSVVQYESLKDITNNKKTMKNMFPMFKGKRKNKYKKDARKLSNSEKVGDPTLNPLLEETAESSKMIAMENGLSSAVYHSNGTSADDKIFSGGKKFVESNNDDIETLENWSIDAIRNKFVENDVDIARRGSYCETDSEAEDNLLASPPPVFTKALSSTSDSPKETYFTIAAENLRKLIKAIRNLYNVRVYRNLIGAMTALYFVVTGVQFWGTKYLSIVLQQPLPLVNALFILCAATGPTLGVFFGGWVVDRYGGYKGARQRVVTLEICSVLCFLGCAFAVPVTFLRNIFGAVLLLWLVLFFGGAVLPASSGIIVSVVPRRYRTISSSISLFVFNMFGYFMSLILSGYLMQVIEYHQEICSLECSMTWGFRLVLFWSFVSFYFIVSALLASYKTLGEKIEKHLSRNSSRTDLALLSTELMKK